MTINSNPFIADTAETMSDLMKYIKQNDSLDPAKQGNVLCSIRRFCQLLAIDPAAAPVHADFYRKKLKGLSAQKAGLTKLRFANIKSDVRWALKTYIADSDRKTYMAPLSEDWRILNLLFRGGRLSWTLSRFMRYCSAQDIKPRDVNDEVSTAFLAALIAETFIGNPRELHRRICKAWNKAVDIIPGWPPQRLTQPSYRQTYTLPWETFPESLTLEAKAWEASLRGVDLLSDNHLDRPLSERTIETRLFQLRQIASALVHQGLEPRTITSLSMLTEIETVRTAMQFFLDRSKGQTTSQIFQFVILLTGIAKHWLKRDEDDIAALQRLKRRVSPAQIGMTESNREKLRQFEDPVHLMALFDFPASVFAKVRKKNRITKREAVRVQIALAVEFLLVMPIRAGNLAALNIDTHLQWSRGRKAGDVHLVIPAEEVKNKEHLEFIIPDEPRELLESYLEEYRPVLLDQPSPWLFPGHNGNPKGRSCLSTQITKHILKEIGLNIHPHLFRHLAAKLYLDEHPGGYEVVRRTLAHRSMDTTVRAYAGLESKSAAAHFDQTILGIRDTLREASRRAPNA